MKKKIVLIILFVLPLTVYLFFSTGVNQFARLPIVSKGVQDLHAFRTQDLQTVLFENNITVLGFLGNDVQSRIPNVFNLTHKIYKPYNQFRDLQFVMVIQEGNEHIVEDLLIELKKIAPPEKWKFVYGSSEAISSLYNSLKTNEPLNEKLSSEKVFIIDKNSHLRGRNDDKDYGTMYGYNTSTIAELNNKMQDDMKVILAEYRLELKKNNLLKDPQ